MCKVIKIGLLLLLPAFLGRAQSLIDPKGTIVPIDTSKWKLSGTAIYNKNAGSVGIGTNGAAHADAALEVKATDKGFLVPRVALTSLTAAAPLGVHVAGMMVYNTATAGTAPNNVSPGFYYNNGTVWIMVADAATVARADTTNDAWVNDNTNTQVKLGALSDGTSARDAGTEFIIKDNGKVGIGTSNPTWQLDVQGPSAIGQLKRIGGVPGQAPGFLFTRVKGSVGAEANIANGDYLGKIQFRGRVSSSEQDFSALSFIAEDVAGLAGRFSFTKGLSTELMVIKTGNGNVGIGTATPRNSCMWTAPCKLPTS